MINVYTVCPTEYFGSNCYLVGGDKHWLVIDPSIPYEKACAKHPEIEGHIDLILLTHAHFDHILSLDTWAAVCDDVRIGKADADMLSDPALNCYLGFLGVRSGYYGSYKTIDDGDIINFGDITISVMSTPGHTPGSVCYTIENAVFTGDTLFSDGGFGRSDLPGGDESALWRSIYRIFSQNMIGKFYPGHGFPDTFENSIKYFE